MSGIGNTIETDLVGELVEIWDIVHQRPGKPLGTSIVEPPKEPYVEPMLRARGRVRAVTSDSGDKHGSLSLWLEIVDADHPASGRWNPFRAQIGDVIRWGVNGTSVIRLIKEQR